MHAHAINVALYLYTYTYAPICPSSEWVTAGRHRAVKLGGALQCDFYRVTRKLLQLNVSYSVTTEENWNHSKYNFCHTLHHVVPPSVTTLMVMNIILVHKCTRRIFQSIASNYVTQSELLVCSSGIMYDNTVKWTKFKC